MSHATRTEELSNCIAFSVEAMSAVIDAASRLRFERGEMPQVYAVALHATSIEQFHSCIAMVEARQIEADPAEQRYQMRTR
jgi:hypothetical protein